MKTPHFPTSRPQVAADKPLDEGKGKRGFV